MTRTVVSQPGGLWESRSVCTASMSNESNRVFQVNQGFRVSSKTQTKVKDSGT